MTVLSDRIISFLFNLGFKSLIYSGCALKIAHVSYLDKTFIKVKYYFICYELLMMNWVIDH